MSRPSLCAAGKKLRDQINRRYPKRDKRSDGWIGDASHQARPSDHNPDPKTGIVRAIDIDADLTAENKRASWQLAETLRAQAKADGRIKYIIHQGQICSRLTLWRWKRHNGNPHHHHIHVSFTTKGDTDGRPFQL